MLNGRASSVVLVATLLAGCVAAGDQAETDSEPVVIGTTTMLGDVVGDIMTCAGGTAETLMPVGADPHDFAPSSAQVAAVVQADLVVANGLGLEAGLADTLRNAAADGATVLEVAPLVDPIPFGAADQDAAAVEPGIEEGHDDRDRHDDGHDGHDDHAHGSLDPHFWHDVSRMADAATLIGEEIAAVTEDDTYAECGTQVHDALMETDQQVRDTLAVVPKDRRILVTDHDAFGYLAEAYDFAVAGVVVPGGSTLGEPSSQELAELVATIRRVDVPAIFSSTTDSAALTEAVANEVGTDVAVVPLFVSSLGGPGSGAETYSDMESTNAVRIAEALG